MALLSSPAAAGAAALSNQYNLLRQDVQTHEHEGTDTAKVDHLDLLSIGYSHALVDAHIDAEQGVHSAGDAVPWVALSLGAQLKIQTGESTAENVVEGGWTAVDVGFPISFSAAPKVFPLSYQTGTYKKTHFVISAVSTSGFTVQVRLDETATKTITFWWLAIGT